MYLSLPIPKVNRNGVKDGPVTLNECLDLFAELELLDGDNKWYLLQRERVTAIR